MPAIPESVLKSPKARAEMLAFAKSRNAVAAAHEAAAETPDELDVLPLWQATATTAKAVHLSKTGAAILPQGPITDAHIPRRKGWKSIVGKITQGHNRLAGPILREAEFWHHQSTNGRWNPDLGRFERWCVRSVGDWLDKLQDGDDRPSESTFRRAKDDLVKAGLIVSETHFWGDKGRCVWIRPTFALTRILFEPGHWETVRDSHSTEAKPKKPRGNSAAHARYTAEAAGWYQRVRDYTLPSGMTDAERWTLFRWLTEPQKIGEKHTVQPFAPAGSHRHRVLRDTLLP